MDRTTSLWLRLVVIAIFLAFLTPLDAGLVRAQAEPASDSVGASSAAPAPAKVELVPSRHKIPERLTHKPSGFWTSNRPSEGGAYKYRLLGIGVVFLLLSGGATIWVVRRYGRSAS